MENYSDDPDSLSAGVPALKTAWIVPSVHYDTNKVPAHKKEHGSDPVAPRISPCTSCPLRQGSSDRILHIRFNQ